MLHLLYSHWLTGIIFAIIAFELVPSLLGFIILRSILLLTRFIICRISRIDLNNPHVHHSTRLELGYEYFVVAIVLAITLI